MLAVNPFTIGFETVFEGSKEVLGLQTKVYPAVPLLAVGAPPIVILSFGQLIIDLSTPALAIGNGFIEIVDEPVIKIEHPEAFVALTV